MDYVDVCPPSVVMRIQEADLADSDTATIFTWIEMNSQAPCAQAALEPIADRIGPRTDLQVFDLFCNAVASYGAVLDEGAKAKIKAAYLRYPYTPSIATNYFLGLRLARIDLRAELDDEILPDWSFANPLVSAPTWSYYLYLAALDEPGALEALADKIARTEDGNDLSLLLMDLNQLPGEGVTQILRRYENDPRRAKGVEGPGMPVAQNVQIMLSMR